MYLTHAEFREHLTQHLIPFLQILQVDLLTFGNQREDNIDLTALTYLVADAVIKRRQTAVENMLSDNGFTTWRQLVNDADVEVTIEGHGQCSGNRRSRHHKDMWRVRALAPQLSALSHTKAVLLINDDHAEAGKLHGVLNDGMGTNKDVDGTIEKTVENLLTTLAFDDTRQQSHADRHVAEELHDGL